MGAVDLQLYTLMNNDSLDFIFRPSGDITQEVTVARMESLRKAASRAQPPDRVIGGKIRTTPDGWTLEIDRRAIKTTHPWKVTANGDNSVTVAAGSILTWRNEPDPGISTIPSYLNLEEVIRFDGDTLDSISDEDTVIWANCKREASGSEIIFQPDADLEQIDRVIPDSTSTVTLNSGTAMPTSGTEDINLELARITVEDGVVTIDRQILTHNPPMWLIDIPPSIL